MGYYPAGAVGAPAGYGSRLCAGGHYRTVRAAAEVLLDLRSRQVRSASPPARHLRPAGTATDADCNRSDWRSRTNGQRSRTGHCPHRYRFRRVSAMDIGLPRRAAPLALSRVYNPRAESVRLSARRMLVPQVFEHAANIAVECVGISTLRNPYVRPVFFPYLLHHTDSLSQKVHGYTVSESRFTVYLD